MARNTFTKCVNSTGESVPGLFPEVLQPYSCSLATRSTLHEMLHKNGLIVLRCYLVFKV